MRYVIRVGDGDDYHLCEDLDEVAGLLKESGVRNFGECHPMGLSADNFEGNNYISLYASRIMREDQIGDREDSPRSLSGEEVIRLRGILHELWFEEESHADR